MSAPRVLLTVSGAVPSDLDEQVAAGRRPRADYRVIGHTVDADVVDIGRALAMSGRTGRLLLRLGGPGALLSWYAFRRRHDYDVLFTDGEQVGIPLAIMTRLLPRGRAKHVMIVHILSVRKKAALMRATRAMSRIDRYVVYCTKQAEFLHTRLGVSHDRIVVSPFMVDTAFFEPVDAPRGGRPVICSAGLERRDYPTLMRAVDGLDVDVIIAAASPWSKQADSTAGQPIPSNVQIERLDLFELRQLYARSQFVVMPLVEVDFQAGITTILEAMSMGRPVLCTRTSGQTDTIIDGQTGAYVPPGDPVALREAIVRWLADPAEVARLGDRAREWAVAHADVSVYAERLAGVVAAVAGDAS